MAKKKFYVVWQGVEPGVYSSWDECKAQVSGFENARYKSFDTQEEAENAFNDNPWKHIGKAKQWRVLEVGAPAFPRWSRTIAFYKNNGFKEIGPRLNLSLLDA